MNGVEILSSETIYNTILPEWFMAVGFILMFAFVMLMSWSIVGGKTAWFLISIVSIICSIVLCALGGSYSKTDISHIEHKVTIDDSVSMNEFIDNYEILDQEGKIYTVKERE